MGLILKRKRGQAIIIGPSTTPTRVEVSHIGRVGLTVALDITADRETVVDREEVWREKRTRERAGANDGG